MNEEECEYCKKFKDDKVIDGRSIRTFEWQETAGYEKTDFDYLEMFILKGKNDPSAGLMIINQNGARYTDINYCPFCGRKLVE